MSGRWQAGHGLVLSGLLPVRRDQIGADLLAGLTLAALGIPEVLGYARIAGMPVVTGLYTMLAPMVVFALLGASRHLVVGADSATAAILAAALTGMAVAGSAHYVALAGLVALLTGVLLLLARLARLGFLANFLSRTVLVGFLTGVGIAVGLAQLPDLLGVRVPAGDLLWRAAQALRVIGQADPASVGLSIGVLAAVLGMRRLAPRFPAALVAVIGAIVASRVWDLPSRGVAVLGEVPAGLPGLTMPALHPADIGLLLGTAASMVAVILAQSAATARAYAVRYDEPFTEGTDLVGLGAANLAAAVTGTFVVNGSPTKTQMVDGAGGRTQLAMLSTAVTVVVAVLWLTGPLSALPDPALAAVVLVIAVELVDVAGMRRILRLRRDEFAVAGLTALAVVALGVSTGIVVAAVASIIDHLRHSYRPRNSVLVKSVAGHWQAAPVVPGARTEGGLVVYRFGTSLYYANAARLQEDVTDLLTGAVPLRWLVLDGAAIGDVDYSAAAVLAQIVATCDQHGVRFATSSLLPPVLTQLDRYGIGASRRPCFQTPGEALEAYRAGAG